LALKTVNHFRMRKVSSSPASVSFVGLPPEKWSSLK
jgi:hypothetical protein